MKLKILRTVLIGVIVLTATMAQAVTHTPLLFTKERINMAKQLIKNDTLRQKGWNEIKAEADKQLERNDINKAEYLAVTYFMTGDKQYAQKLRQILLDVAKQKSWGDAEMEMRKPKWRSHLGMAHRSYQAAMAYDAAYGILSASERKTIADGLIRLAVEPAIGDWLLEPTRIHSLNSMGHNWWTSCVCMGGLLALTLQNESPKAAIWAERVNEVLPQWFDFAGDDIQGKPKTFDDAGGMYESLNYASFGISEALLFRLAWKNVQSEKSMPDIPQLEKLPSYFIHVCYPRTGMLYSLDFGDSHKNIVGDVPLKLLYALGYKDSNILWYLSQNQENQHRDGYFLNRPMGMLYTPDLSQAPTQPNLSVSQLFADFGWATLRNSWNKDATMLAAKSGYTWNHSHADANSFILFHRGIDIIKDGGHCWYPRPEYRNYFFQSQAHNVVLFNGKGQPREQQYHGALLRGYMSEMLDAGNIKYVVANGTGPYSDQFSRNLRHFLWMDNVIYIIDDLKTHDVGHFEWLWHPNGKTDKKGIDINVTNRNSSIVIRPLYPQTLAKSDFVHDYPDDLYWEKVEAPNEDLKTKDAYYSFHLPAKTDRVKGLTAIILKDDADQKELPQMERREGKDWIGLRITYKGKVTDLYINQLADGRLMHSNSWIEADGWTTDAYMFAVSYKEGTAPAETGEMFVCYGSAVRRGRTSFFSSLAKLFTIVKYSGGKMNISLSGQPKMYVSFKAKSRPSSITVNGKSSSTVYKKEQITIITNP